MNFSTVSNIELTTKFEKLVHTERKLTHIILLHILEIESRRIYAELGYDGMFSYLTKRFGYSEPSAYRRLQAARLLKIIPSAAGKLESGALNLTQLTQVQKCLKVETGQNLASDLKQKNSACSKHESKIRIEGILSKIENKNNFETNKILAFEFNQTVQTTQTIKPQKDDSVRMEITLTKEQFENLQESRNLMSHSVTNGN